MAVSVGKTATPPGETETPTWKRAGSLATIRAPASDARPRQTVGSRPRAGHPMRLGYRVRLVLNAVNGSTLLGVLVATMARAHRSAGGNGLVLAERYRLPVPAAPAFTV